MTRFLVFLPLALLACSGDGKSSDESGTPGDDDDDFELPGVMRDCVANLGDICPYAGAGYNGWNGEDVHRLDAWFSTPLSIAFPPAGVAGRPVIADWNNHKLRAVNDDPADGLDAIMGTDFLGDGDAALSDRTPAGALGTDISLNHPTQQMYYSDGMLLSASWHTHKFREWDPATGIVHVVLGSRGGIANDPETGAPIEFDQDEATVLMNQPKEVVIDRNNEDLIYYLDMRNERIRLWDRATGKVNTIAGETVDGSDDDTAVGSKGYCGEGEALLTCLNFPKNANPEPGGGLALSDDSSTLYIADTESHVIRVVDLTATPPTISLLSGTPLTPGFADGAAADAMWDYPADLTYDGGTNSLFVADTNNNRIRHIDLTTLQVTTVAGTGEPTCVDTLICPEQQTGGDGGPAVEATLYRPYGIDLDPDGNLVISDSLNHRLRIVYR